MPKKKTKKGNKLRAFAKKLPPLPTTLLATSTTPRQDAIAKIRAVHSKSSKKNAGAIGKKVAKLIASFTKKYETEVISTVAGGSRAENVNAVPSGWQEIDDLITGETDALARTIVGTGLGWPRGRIMEVFGAEGVGKTTLTLLMVKAFQDAGLIAAFVDAEHALDVDYAVKLGVRVDQLLLSQPNGAEQTLDIVDDLAGTGDVSIIVVDSVAALVPEDELEDDMADAHVALHARLMSKACRKLTGVVARNDVLLVFINQMRMKIGVKFGNPNTTTGGNALKYYASVRLEMTNMGQKKKGDRITHRRTRIKAIKNKVAPPFREIFCDFAPNKGIIAAYGDNEDGGGDDAE